MSQLFHTSLNIPQLVQEKVDFYYYWDQWHQRIIKLHQEYLQKVHIISLYNRTHDDLFWLIKPYYTMYICNIYDQMESKSTKIFINRFTLHIPKYYTHQEIPNKYHYSSGLNSIEGYKHK